MNENPIKYEQKPQQTHTPNIFMHSRKTVDGGTLPALTAWFVITHMITKEPHMNNRK